MMTEAWEFLKGKIGKPLAQYSGQMVADLTPEMLLAQRLMGTYQPDKYDVMVNAALQQALSGQPSYDVSPKATEKYFKSGVEQPMLREFDRSVRPRIDQSFARAGALGSTQRGVTTAGAMGDLQSKMAAILGGWQQGNQALSAQLAESAAGRQMQGIQLAPQVAMNPLNAASALQSVSSPYYQRQQQVLDTQYQQWLRGQPEGSPWLQMATALIGTPTTNTIVTPGQQSTPFNWGALGSLAGGIYGLNTAADPMTGLLLGSLLGGQAGSLLR
jgi:hypothetical protein